MEDDNASVNAKDKELSDNLSDDPQQTQNLSIAEVLEEIKSQGRITDINRVVTDEFESIVLQRIEEIIHTRELSEVLGAEGLKIDSEHKKIIVPSNFLTLDETVMSMTVLCRARTNYQMLTFDTDVPCNLAPGKEDFIYGLLLALQKPKYIKLKSDKKLGDLGLAVGMSLRLRGWAEKNNNIAALRPNNFFFGNNPGEFQVIGKKKVSVDYGAKGLIIDCFKNAKAGEWFSRLITFTLKHIDIDDLDVDLGLKFLYKNLKNFEDIVKRGWVPITNKKGKEKTVVGYRRATLPQRNSMFLKEEMKVIHVLLSPFFSSLESIKLRFHEILFRDSWSALEKLVIGEYHTRHEILARLSAVTTKRLQEIRKLPDVSKTLKKKEVTQQMVILCLAKRAEPTNSFIGEVREIIGNESLARAFSSYAKQVGVPVGGNIALAEHILEVYQKNGVFGDKKIEIKKTITTDADYIQHFESVARLNNKLTGTCIFITNNLRKFNAQVTAEARGLIRVRLYPQIKELDRVCNELLKVDKTVLEASLFLGWWNKDLISASMLKDILSITESLLEVLKEGTEYKTLPSVRDAQVAARFKEVQLRWDATGASQLK